MATFAQPHSRFTYSNSGQNVRLWLDMMAACGWEQTDLSGQVTPENAPTSSGGAYWLMFRSTDALTEQLPIYLRVNFVNMQRGNYNGSWVQSIVVSFDVTSEGVMLNSSTIYQVTGSTSYPAVVNSQGVASMFASGDGGSLRVCDLPGYFAYSSSYQEQFVHAANFFGIARIKDEDGNPTAEGVVLIGPSMYMSTECRPLSVTTKKPAGEVVTRSRSLCPILLQSVDQPGQTAAVGGMPQMQHPWACTPRLYPFEDIGMFPNHNAAAIGDVLNIQQGADARKYLFLGRTGAAPSTVGYSGQSRQDVTADMYLEVGYAILWE